MSWSDPGRLARLRVPEDPAVDDRVGLGRREQARQDGAADVGLDEVGALELDRRRRAVDPGQVLDRRIALEPARQLGAPVARRRR